MSCRVCQSLTDPGRMCPHGMGLCLRSFRLLVCLLSHSSCMLCCAVLCCVPQAGDGDGGSVVSGSQASGSDVQDTGSVFTSHADAEDELVADWRRAKR